MGIKPFLSWSSSQVFPDTDTTPNPNKYRFTVEDTTESPKYFMVVIKYEHCTEHKGRKVLVYKIKHKEEVLSMIKDKDLDPHFLENQTSPIARFPGSIEGIALAIEFIGFEPWMEK
jgi:hypothetical protein